MIYQGQEHHLDGPGTPKNREALWLSKYDTSAELYILIQKLNKIRKHAYNLGSDYVDEQTRPVFRGGSELAFSKGVEGRQIVMLLSTQGTQASAYDLQLPVTYNAGTTITEVLNCKNYTIDSWGQLVVPMVKGEPRVFYPTQLMEGSGLCGYSGQRVTLAELKTGEVVTQGSSGSSLARTRSMPVVVAVILSLVGGLAL